MKYQLPMIRCGRNKSYLWRAMDSYDEPWTKGLQTRKNHEQNDGFLGNEMPETSNEQRGATWDEQWINEANGNEQWTKWSYLHETSIWQNKAMDEMKLPETSINKMKVPEMSNWQNEVTWDYQKMKWNYLRWAMDKWSYLRWTIDKMKLSETSNWRKQWIRWSCLRQA
jgi:hypothetical protein